MTTGIDPRQLRARLDMGERFQLIDVRGPQEYAEGHIPCSVNLPMDEVEARLDDLQRHDPVVLVCRSGNRARLTEDLLKPHRNDLVVLEGGVTAWEAAGLPMLATTSARLPLMRQVQLVVGPLVMLSVVLALTVDVRWVGLAGFIGAGLTLAGATGWCGMANLLALLPMNRPKPSARRAAGACSN